MYTAASNAMNRAVIAAARLMERIHEVTDEAALYEAEGRVQAVLTAGLHYSASRTSGSETDDDAELFAELVHELVDDIEAGDVAVRDVLVQLVTLFETVYMPLCQRAGLDPLETWAAILRDFYVSDGD